jgi:hypothetical protein
MGSMKTFYSIIKIASNSVAGDMLSIGLLVHNGETVYLKFSDEKKQIAKKIIDGADMSIDFICQQIQQKIDKINGQNSHSENSLFPRQLSNIFNEETISQFSAYSNGLVRFGEPVFLNDNLTEEKFFKLYQLLVDKSSIRAVHGQVNRESRIKELVDSKLIKRVQEIVHTNLELTPKTFPGLYYPFTIDCIGKNGSFIGAKTISFDRKAESIDREVSHYMTLITLLDKQYSHKGTNDKFYIIGDEPGQTNSKEHQIWADLIKSPVVQLINPDDSEKVAEEIESNGASKFIKL